MKKRIILLLTMIGLTAFLIPRLQAGDSLPPARFDCPSCPSFGVLRFLEKRDAPLFSLKCLDGNTITLSELKGKPIMLTFWASWCPGCKEEIPLIEKFSTGKRDPLTILTMAIDGEREKRIQRLVKELKISLPVLLDVKEKIARTYGVRMVPTTFLIDGEGLMVGMIVGQRDWSLPEAWSSIRELFSLR